MPTDDNNMSQEAEIMSLGKDIQHLTNGFNELKEILEKRNLEMHDHINRKFSDEMTIGLLTLKNEMMKYTDDKVSISVSELKTVIKTWASLVVVAVVFTVSVITYVNSSNTGNTSNVSEMTDLFKTMMQESRKTVKQTEIIIQPKKEM